MRTQGTLSGWKPCLALALAALLGPACLAQEGAATESGNDPCAPGYEGQAECRQEETKKPRIKPLAEFIADKTRIPGLFDFYQDPKSGQLYMAVSMSQLDQEFIYFAYTRNGAVRKGLPSFGEIRYNSVIRIRRQFGRVDFIQQNTSYVVPEDSPLRRVSDANVSSPLLSASRIVAESPDGKVFVIPADVVFTTNRFVTLQADQAQLSKEKSAVRSIRNYPDNTEIVAEYVFDYTRASSPATSSATVVVQHNFIRMPPPGFTPRRDDPRVGYFIEKRTDLTTVDGLPYQDFIQRWRLIKANPAAPVSDPVQPIVFWIENTTPLEYRDTIREAVLAWNTVFEKAGFSNAIQVKVQPDDAEWDAGDIRYNVIRWVATPVPRYLGYSPRFTNPRTGEILGADIVLEHSSVRTWVQYESLFSAQSAESQEAATETVDPTSVCEAGKAIQWGTHFAQLAYSRLPAGSGKERDEIVRQALRYLVLHEVGHALGLTHNLMGSYFSPPEALNGDGARQEQRLVNSVMDYPAVNVAKDPAAQGMYYPTIPGPYDEWAITFGYDERMEDGQARMELLSRSAAPELRFGNDADAMAEPTLGIDPRVNKFDLSSDPIAFAQTQVEIANEIMAQLKTRVAREGESWDAVRRAFQTLLNVRYSAGDAISRYVAGVYVDRAFVGQPTSARAPFTPVDYERKKRAMSALEQLFFAPEAFSFPDDLIGYLQEQRRGFDFYGFYRQDPLIHAWVRAIQRRVLTHLLDSRVLRRQTDSALYGNRYSVHEMLRDLNRAIFAADNGKDVNTFRRNLQVEYVQMMVERFKSGTLDAVSEAALFGALEEIEGFMARSQRHVSAETRTHRRYIRHLIELALEKK